VFDSKREMRRWSELVMLERGGEIRGLERQKRYPLVVKGRQVCTYVADFVYEERVLRDSESTWALVVEDSKGHRTEMYRYKKRMMRACLGIEIRET
jgi:hypothetical protein